MLKLQEVEELFFQYEEKKHEFLQKTQKYFLNKYFQPYIWIDEQHRLRIKQKYRRTIKDYKPNKKREEFIKTVEEYAKKQNMRIRFILEQGEKDTTLPQDINELWSTEIILEVK